MANKKLTKFDFVIGNPPYQGTNHQQLYPDFYLSSKEISNCVEMIFPTGWQEPKTANNLGKLNKKEIKEDKQIVFIDNKQNVFPNVPGAEWTNVIMWKKDHDNGLDGCQKILTEDKNEIIKKLIYDKKDIKKPEKIVELGKLVQQKDFVSIQTITSVRKPYGLSTDVIRDTAKYGLAPLQTEKLKSNDLKIYATKRILYAPVDYELPKISKAKDKYKVFVPYAWGGMDEDKGLGGTFADIIIGLPFEICTETYLESGCFNDLETAKKHAKYLMTKFLRALLYLNKFSQHSTTAWGAIPIQSYKEEWWNETIEEIDKHLFKKYNASNDIVDFVENNIQTKTEANIINFKKEDKD